MAKKANYRTVKGKLGVFGWVSRVLLIGWNVAMLAWMIGGLGVAGDQSSVGGVIGAGIGITMIIVLWVVGTVILGIWALLTRPPKALVPVEDSDSGS